MCERHRIGSNRAEWSQSYGVGTLAKINWSVTCLLGRLIGQFWPRCGEGHGIGVAPKKNQNTVFLILLHPPPTSWLSGPPTPPSSQLPAESWTTAGRSLGSGRRGRATSACVSEYNCRQVGRGKVDVGAGGRAPPQCHGRPPPRSLRRWRPR